MELFGRKHLLEIYSQDFYDSKCSFFPKKEMLTVPEFYKVIIKNIWVFQISMAVISVSQNQTGTVNFIWIHPKSRWLIRRSCFGSGAWYLPLSVSVKDIHYQVCLPGISQADTSQNVFKISLRIALVLHWAWGNRTHFSPGFSSLSCVARLLVG